MKRLAGLAMLAFALALLSAAGIAPASAAGELTVIYYYMPG